MSASQAIGVGIGLLVAAFIAFCFRQGDKVKPRAGIPQTSNTSNPDSDHTN